MTFSLLGMDIQTRKPVQIAKASRLQGLYIIGANGTGKSGLIENLVIEDIKQGLGVCLLDPHGDLTNSVLARLPGREQDVILLDLSEYNFPFGLNLFTCSDPADLKEVAKATAQVMHIFKRLWGKGGIVVEDSWGVLLEEILRNATQTFLELSQYETYTMAEIPMLLENDVFRNRLVQKLTNRYVKNYWINRYNQLSNKDQLEERRSTLNRVNTFLTQPIVENIVGQSRTTIDFRRIMDERKILLVKLNSQMEDVTSLIGSMVIAGILAAAYSRADLPVDRRKQFNLYADEFQRFATEDFATLLTEARKFGIATTVAHQARFQPGMTDGIRATTLQIPNIIVLKVSSQDAPELAGQFDCTPTPSTETRREQIVTVKYDAVNHLLTNGYADKNGNTNKIIDDFISTKLIRLQGPIYGIYRTPMQQELEKQQQQARIQALNKLLYAVMSEKNPYQEISSDLFLFFYYPTYPDFNIGYRNWFRPPAFYHLFPSSMGLSVVESQENKRDNDDEDEEWRHSYEPVGEKIKKDVEQKYLHLWDKINKLYPTLWTSISGDEVEKILEQILLACSEIFPEYRGYLKVREAYKKDLFDLKNKISGATQQIKEKERQMADERWLNSEYKNYVAWMKWRKHKPIKNADSFLQEKLQEMENTCNELRNNIETYNQQIAYYEEEVVNVFTRAVESERQIVIPLLQQDIDALDEFVFAFRSILQTLAHDPIMGPSGQYEEKPIPRTFQDMQNDIANQLVGLPDHRARVRIKDVSNGARVEHTIRTIAPERKGVLRGVALQQRLATIHYRNFTDGYIRSRREIEEEIKKRQHGDKQEPGAKGQQNNDSGAKKQAGSPPPRRRKIDPDEEQKIICKQCGTLNDHDAAFCKKCGQKVSS